MTVSSLPEPFEDITVDRRDAEQQQVDRPTVDFQVGYYRSNYQGNASRDPLFSRLVDRRAGVDGAVKLQVLTDLDGFRTLVVRDEFLVDLTTGNQSDPTAPPLDSELFTRAPLRATGNLDDFDARVGRFVTSSSRSAVLVEEAIARLQSDGYTVGHNRVAVFQQIPTPSSGPGHDVVVKLETGPSPTTVADTRLFLSDAEREPVRAITVAIIDTGITDQTRSDGWFAGIGHNGNRDPLDEFPGPGGNQLLDFAAGHGTFAAGVVQSVEPQANVIVYRALDSDGFGSESDVAAALLDAVSYGAQVVNLSLGIRMPDGSEPVALRAAMDSIAALFPDPASRPVVVAAAGNFGDELPTYPAGFPEVVAVGALSADGSPSPWSSHGPWVDCSTIGEGIVAPYVEGDQDPAFGASAHFGADSWAIWSGTSFAAPQIAGAVARTMREKSLSAQDALADLLAEGTPVPGYGSAMRLLPGTPTT